MKLLDLFESVQDGDVYDIEPRWDDTRTSDAKTVVFVVGRMSPFTAGHGRIVQVAEDLVNKINSNQTEFPAPADMMVMPTQTYDIENPKKLSPKKYPVGSPGRQDRIRSLANVISYPKKIEFARSMLSKTGRSKYIEAFKNRRTINAATASTLVQEQYPNCEVAIGFYGHDENKPEVNDRYQEVVKNEFNQLGIDLIMMPVSRNMSGESGLDTISGTKARNAAYGSDYNNFVKATGHENSPKLHDMFNYLKGPK